ncbi:rho GTPase activator Rga [Coccidioides immitis RS]|uniref:Rho GTPase activator Rga n=3 Tax=Coccidioides immitis TaxID=5501 RepID=J3K929_COCIM|nr:rho GTPase activator Rga [Coccidioides immitis RS]EAS31375.3 rho GTPase activator Rga [Coccidioides immitis RS]KMP04016.1 beta-chimaerin [Coccidioides immitis RMSCC 2394]TPX24178.1 Rho-type gtpase-activating protein [Coccidioides immitis]
MIEKGQLESPTAADYLEDPDDIPIPCKGCGEILEEGKAFELAGNRWHIDCFRCHTCGTYLDSDANLLLLGDGSLICNNCTYSCSSCGSKIEDLAILTGDQAFCANCFKCRNCKRKIENLRYARTSQGIFCMDCHESLMARRRKRSARNATQRQKHPSSAMHLDKSLPSLPPEHESRLPPTEYVELPADVPSRSGVDERQNQDNSAWSQSQQDNLILPASTYNSKRHSVGSQKSDGSAGEEFLIPVAFDPTPSDHTSSRITSPDTSKSADERSRDYYPRSTSLESPSKSSYEQRPPPGSRGSGSVSDRQQAPYQERRSEEAPSGVRRQDGARHSMVPSTSDASQLTRRSQDSNGPRSSDREKFQLSEAPKSKKSSGESTPRSSNESTIKDPESAGSKRKERKSIENSRSTNPATPGQMQHPPKRGDSLESKLHHTLPRKGIESTKSNHAHSKTDKDSVTGVDGNKSDGKTARKPDLKPSVDDSTPVASPRPHTSGNSTLKDQASTPQSLDRRLNHDRNESLSALQSTSRRAESSPSLPRYSAGGDFSLEEDMARIMGDENQNHESFLRRVSNSVRHGRSFSEKGSRLSKELKWPKSPSTGSTFAQDISSPSTSSPEAREELNWFKNELRRERQKIIEKDQKIAELEAALNATANIKEVNTELREKRSTMVFLDAQKEIVLRELEVLREHIATEKQSNAPLDLGKVSNAVLRDLAEALRRLKESFMPQIEELIQKRNDLVEELGNLGRMKDKSFQEFEQLSLKNAQLAELNNQLVHQIQELYKANSNSTDSNRQAPNGLGIYHHKDKSTASVERDLRSITNEPSPGIVQPEEAEPITVVQGPQVVSIRKGQPKKFNWKRGGQNVAKGVTKGLKGAFLYGEGKSQREGAQFTETAPYGSIPPTSDNNSGPQRAQTQDPSRQGFGFFGNQKTKTSQWKPPANGSSSVLNEGSIGLFGSDLEQRLEVERGVIPSIVTRCIEEVELRGMDVEGIYRKSGGSSQVQMVRDGFERSRDFDISDPDLDIHAVTSALKQYFRMLPTPLITYDVYDMLLDANNITPASSRIDVMQHGLQELPRVHRDVLEFLVFHLKRVVDRERENLMTSLNIAVVFAPTIMRPESLSREMTDVQKKNETLQFLVDNCQDIFMGMPE